MILYCLLYSSSSSSLIGACNPFGFWPAQLSLSILSRKVFTECRCQRHVKPPTWRTSDLERSTLRHTRCLQRLKGRERTPAAEGGTMGEKLPRILPKVATSTSILCSFTCRKFTTRDRRLYFPGFLVRKNPTASAEFEPANSGTRGQHAYL